MMTSPDRLTAPQIHQLPIMSLPEASKTILANGVEIVSVNDDAQPVTRITIFWPVGYADVDNCNALALMRAMLVEGTTTHSGAEIAEILEFNGAWIKTDSGRHNTMVTLFLLNKTAETVIPLLGEMLLSSNFPADELERHRENAIAQCRLRQRKVKNLAVQLSNRMIFGKDAPATLMATPEGLSEVERSAVLELHRRLICATTPTVFLAGKIGDRIMQLATSMALEFSPDSKEAITQRIVPAIPLPETSEEIRLVDDSMQTAIRIAIPTIPQSHPDFPALHTAIFTLGGYFGSRLMTNIREDKGYTYGITASLLPSIEGSNIIIQCETDNRFARKVLSETTIEISQLATGTIPPEELDIIKHTAQSELLSILDSPFSILDAYIVEKAFGLPASASFAARQHAILNATAESIRRLSEKYLLHASAAIAMAGNPADD